MDLYVSPSLLPVPQYDFSPSTVQFMAEHYRRTVSPIPTSISKIDSPANELPNTSAIKLSSPDTENFLVWKLHELFGHSPVPDIVSPLPVSPVPLGFTPIRPTILSLPSLDNGPSSSRSKDVPTVVQSSPKRFSCWNKNLSRSCFVMFEGRMTKMTRREARLRNLTAGPKR